VLGMKIEGMNVFKADPNSTTSINKKF